MMLNFSKQFQVLCCQEKLWTYTISHCFRFRFSLVSTIFLFKQFSFRNIFCNPTLMLWLPPISCSLFREILSASIYAPEKKIYKDVFMLSLPESHNLSSTKSVFLILCLLKNWRLTHIDEQKKPFAKKE